MEFYTAIGCVGFKPKAEFKSKEGSRTERGFRTSGVPSLRGQSTRGLRGVPERVEFHLNVVNQPESREGFRNEWSSISQWIIKSRVERGSKMSGVLSLSG